MYRILIKNREQNQTKDFKYSFYSEDDSIFQTNNLNKTTDKFRELMDKYLLPDLSIVSMIETNVSIESPDLKVVNILPGFITLINNGTDFAILLNLTPEEDKEESTTGNKITKRTYSTVNICKTLGRAMCACPTCGIPPHVSSKPSTSTKPNTPNDSYEEFTAVDVNEEIAKELKSRLMAMGLTNIVIHPTTGITAENTTGKPLEGTLEIPKGLFLFYSRTTRTTDYVSSAFSVVLTDTSEPIVKEVYELNDISFPDSKYIFDGEEKSIVIGEELPEGIKVEYKDNTRTEIGIQTATATFIIDEESELFENYDTVNVNGTESNILTAELEVYENDDTPGKPEYPEPEGPETPIINKEELNKVIREIENIKKQLFDYDADSYTSFEDTYEEAKLLPETTQEEIDAKARGLKFATGMLIKRNKLTFKNNNGKVTKVQNGDFGTNQGGTIEGYSHSSKLDFTTTNDPENKHFNYWAYEDGTPYSYYKDTQIQLNRDTELEAVYSDTKEDMKDVIEINSYNFDRTSEGKFVFVFYINTEISESKKIVDEGFLVSREATTGDSLTLDNTINKISKKSLAEEFRYNFGTLEYSLTYSKLDAVAAYSNLSIRPYVIIEDESGNQSTIYGRVVGYDFN